MRAIDIGVGHDNDAVITQFISVVFVLPDAATKHIDQRGDFLRRQQLFETCFLNIQNFALERQYGLKLSVASLFGRASG